VGRRVVGRPVHPRAGLTGQGIVDVAGADGIGLVGADDDALADDERPLDDAGAGLVADEVVVLRGDDGAVEVVDRDGVAGVDELGVAEVGVDDVDGVTTVARRCGTWWLASIGRTRK